MESKMDKDVKIVDAEIVENADNPNLEEITEFVDAEIVGSNENVEAVETIDALNEEPTNEDFDPKSYEWKQDSAEALIKHLRPLHRSTVYDIIKNYVQPWQISDIKRSNALYKEWQVIRGEAEESHKHDIKTPAMMDIDKACTNVYRMVLKLMNAMMKDMENEFTKIHDAIGKIEDKLDIERTEFVKEDYS
jgi:hypothetical protein